MPEVIDLDSICSLVAQIKWSLLIGNIMVDDILDVVQDKIKRLWTEVMLNCGQKLGFSSNQSFM